MLPVLQSRDKGWVHSEFSGGSGPGSYPWTSNSVSFSMQDSQEYIQWDLKSTRPSIEVPS